MPPYSHVPDSAIIKILPYLFHLFSSLTFLLTLLKYCKVSPGHPITAFLPGFLCVSEKHTFLHIQNAIIPYKKITVIPWYHLKPSRIKFSHLE